MSKTKIIIEHEVKKFGFDNIAIGDFIEYKGEIYKFEGYDFGTSPIARKISDNKQYQLPHF